MADMTTSFVNIYTKVLGRAVARFNTKTAHLRGRKLTPSEELFVASQSWLVLREAKTKSIQGFVIELALDGKSPTDYYKTRCADANAGSTHSIFTAAMDKFFTGDKDSIVGWEIKKLSDWTQEGNHLYQTTIQRALCQKESDVLGEFGKQIFSTSTPAIQQAVRATETMSPVVFRRWLKHENVDFQSFDSYLARLSYEQIQSLLIHEKLIRDGAADSSLPCFREGLTNKIWNIASPNAEVCEKYAPSQAVATNFLGLGLGFPLYPDATSDIRNPLSTITQLHSLNPDKGFVVNQEILGLYWLLYRKLRSNELWNTDQVVKPGFGVCPGFWYTIIMWLASILVPPIALVAAWFSYGGFAVVFMAIALISPVFYGLNTVLYMLRRTAWNSKVWKAIGKRIAFGGLILVLAGLLKVTYENSVMFWTLCTLIVMGFLAQGQEDTGSEDSFPGIFIPLMGILVLALGWDIYQIVAIYSEIVMKTLMIVWTIVMYILPVAAICFGGYFLFKRLDIYYREHGIPRNSISQKNEATHQLFRSIGRGGLIGLLTTVLLGCTLVVTEVDISYISFLLMLGCVGVSIVCVQGLFWKSPRAIWIQNHLTLSGKYHQMIETSNPALWENGKFVLDRSDIYRLGSDLEEWFDLDIVISLFQQATSIQGLRNLSIHIRTKLGFKIWTTSSSFRSLFLSGIPFEEMATQWMEEGHGKWKWLEFEGIRYIVLDSEKQKLISYAPYEVRTLMKQGTIESIWEKLGKIARPIGHAIGRVFTPVIGIFILLIAGIGYILGLIGTGISHIRQLWKLFHDRCPAFPTFNKTSIK